MVGITSTAASCETTTNAHSENGPGNKQLKLGSWKWGGNKTLRIVLLDSLNAARLKKMYQQQYLCIDHQKSASIQ